MQPIKPKKILGQHFLHDRKIAFKIASLLKPKEGEIIIEVGPGTGALTQFFIPFFAIYPERFEKILIDVSKNPFLMIEMDNEAYDFLSAKIKTKSQDSDSVIIQELNSAIQIIRTDILTFSLEKNAHYCFISNLPYNISSPFLFYLLENRELINSGVFMVQKEVAKRICSPPGNKEYGILSVLLNCYYEIKYQFSVSKGAFFPPPKVESAVFTLVKKVNSEIPTVYFPHLKKVVKAAFNQRRKNLGNALHAINFIPPEKYRTKRAEELSPEIYVELANLFSNNTPNKK